MDTGLDAGGHVANIEVVLLGQDEVIVERNIVVCDLVGPGGARREEHCRKPQLERGMKIYLIQHPPELAESFPLGHAF